MRLFLSLLLFSCDEQRPVVSPATMPSATVTSVPVASVSVTAASPVASAEPFAPEQVWVSGKAMGTHLQFAGFTQPGKDAAFVRGAFERAIAEFERIEALMTTWKDTSEISRVNAAAGKAAIEVGPETLEVVQASLDMSAKSQGTFDITFETLHGLWKFDEDLDPTPPKNSALKAKLKLMGYRHVQLDRDKRTLRIDTAGVKISLGGIAKGYAVDKAVAVLDQAGLASFFVQAGGDLFARGKKPNGNEWSAGVRDPRGPAEKYFAMVSLSDHSFSTAGDYERSYVKAGKRYHHIIDPRTGYPAAACRSVTIWAKSAFVADAVDDAVFILGPTEGLKLVESIDGVGAVIVDAKNQVWISERMAGKVMKTGMPTDGL
jgi:FAD:protein FMN transferase